MAQTPQNEIIADGLRLSIGLGEKLLDGVSPDIFGRMAHPGGAAIVSNHGAFIYGHLAFYAPRVIQMAGGPKTSTPDGFAELFADGVECVDDADGSHYPAMDVITDAFFSGYNAALEAVVSASPDVFDNPNPTGGSLTEKFPTIGSMCGFMSCGHIMLHMGQMSAWRRMQGLGSA
jgi:hypothetical protein